MAQAIGKSLEATGLAIAKTVEAAAVTGQKGTELAGKTGLRAAEVGSETGIAAAKLGSKTGLAAAELGSKTGLAAAKVGSEAGLAAAKLASKEGLEGAQIASNVGKEAAKQIGHVGVEGSTGIAKESFKGTTKITGQAFQLASGILGSILSAGEETGKSIKEKIQRDKDLTNIRKYIETNGVDSHAKKIINKEVQEIIDASVKTLETIRKELIKELDRSYYHFRMRVLCKEHIFDVYYTNRAILNASKICPREHIVMIKEVKGMIENIKGRLANGNRETYGFTQRIGLVTGLKTKVISVINLKSYNDMCERLAVKIDEFLDLDTLSNIFNDLVDKLNDKIDAFFEQEQQKKQEVVTEPLPPPPTEISSEPLVDDLKLSNKQTTIPNVNMSIEPPSENSVSAAAAGGKSKTRKNKRKFTQRQNKTGKTQRRK